MTQSIYEQSKELEVVLDEIHEMVVDRHGISDDLAIKTLTAQARAFAIVCDAEKSEFTEATENL